MSSDQQGSSAGVLRFTKMHGCGNDYVYLDAWRQDLPEDLPALAQVMSQRRFGVGSDGLVVLGPGQRQAARMRMFNADGSESEMCGNALRCCAWLAFTRGHIGTPEMVFETGAGDLPVTCLVDDQGRCTGVRVAMGTPRLEPSAVPVDHPGPGPLLELALDDVDRVPWRMIAVGMGNPHAVCCVDDVDQAPVTSVGPRIECHPRFPRRTNVEFIARLADEDGTPVLRQRTWERGAGETWACGTGAAAATVAAMLTGLIPHGSAIVRLNGGDLRMSWDGHGDVVMIGPASHVYDGEWPLA